MQNTISIHYPIQPRSYKKFKACIKDLETYFAAKAARENIKFRDIAPIYDPKNGEMVTGFDIIAERVFTENNPTADLLPVGELVKAIIDQSRQDVVDGQKSNEQRQALIEDLSRLDERIQVDGEPYVPAALQKETPSLRALNDLDGATKKLPIIHDIDKGRITINNLLRTLPPEVAEIFREMHRKNFNPAVFGDNVNLTLSQAQIALELMSEAISHAQELLKDPFNSYSGDDND